MGCDIHLFIEKKIKVKGIETWVNCDDFRINPFYTEDGKNGNLYEQRSIYLGRNYELFCILANVRGYCENTISDPKGLPEDVSSIVKDRSDYWKDDGHSHSYLTLKEINNFLSENPTVWIEGMISPESIKELESSGKTPTMSAGFTTSEGWDYRTWEEESPLAGLANKITERLKEEFYLFDDDKIEEFDEKIRIVFWFDN